MIEVEKLPPNSQIGFSNCSNCNKLEFVILLFLVEKRLHEFQSKDSVSPLNSVESGEVEASYRRMANCYFILAERLVSSW
jgi:hypothetical protein